jgi:hypothetical protein
MKTLAQLIAEWLSGWNECIICEEMCDEENIVCTNEDTLMCLDCFKDIK